MHKLLVFGIWDLGFGIWDLGFRQKILIIGEKIRNLRNNLSTKVKASIFKIFDKLPPINSNATAAEITAWKRSPIVLECYKKLFTEIENTSEKYIVRIIKNAWPKKEFIPDSHTAWCVSIAEILLNLNNEYIQITEDVIQPFFEKNLVNDNGDDDDDYNNNNNDYNNDDYNNNNNDYNDYNNNNVNNEDDFQIIEDDR
ncbi:hypothetical protein Glove_1g42 [Diversispora epigaea]|uniref:Uncharacterized protein n=1 Tax=Diversispora epigaea TaxID=1348612 RepID=A0A397JRG9_9GLOM|nr:hypothetical protein Glove_1g42 [Diversispora epigaea]